MTRLLNLANLAARTILLWILVLAASALLLHFIDVGIAPAAPAIQEESEEDNPMLAEYDEEPLPFFGTLISPLATAVSFTASENTNERFNEAPHLRMISNAIYDAVMNIGPKFLVISMPPQHGKSTLISRRTPEWYLGLFPHKRVAIGGYGADFASNWGRLIRNDIEKHEDELGFGIASDSSAADDWHTTEGGRLWTAGITSGATGKPADFLIIDDPVKNAQEAYSPVYRERVWQEFQRSFWSRLHPDGVAIIVMTRWHKDDLAGRLLSGHAGTNAANWHEINLPAIWMNDEPFVYPTGEIRRKGEALWEVMWPAEFLIRAKKGNTDAETWEALYQQRPRGATGIGAAYKSFEKKYNTSELVEYDSLLEIHWSLDFNIDPMCSIIGQVKETFAANAYLTNEKVITAEVFDEICVSDFRTEQACEEFHNRMQKIARGKRLMIHLHGDATGARRDTRSNTNDWGIIKDFFIRNKAHYATNYHLKKSNPGIGLRVGAVNAALKNAVGERRLMINPRCKKLVNDLENVAWKRDSNGVPTGALDGSEKELTHVSDALGYMMFDVFGTSGNFAGEVSPE